MANTYLTWTPSNSGTRAKWTFSAWVKKGETTGNGTLFFSGGSNSDYSKILLQSSGKLYISEVGGGSTIWEIQTNRLFRDASAFYHIVIVYDSGQGTASNRVKIYVNGVQETSLSATSYPAQNRGAQWLAGGQQHRIGRDYISQYFGGVMSHINFSDGYALAPTVFGSTDSTTGEWKINTSPSFTLGTYGFTILKDGSTITDQSSNSNNWSLGGGTLTNTKDCPSNVMATMNPLFAGDANITYSNGNLKTTAANASQKNAVSTIAVSSGKWYCEMVSRNGTNYPGFGIMDSQSVLQTSVSYLGSSSDSYCMFQDGNYYTNGSASNTGTTWGVGSIMGLSIDLDSSTKTIKFYKNGSQTHSATIATPANAYVFAVSHNTNGTITEMNFGEGFFGTVAAGTNADGNGQGLFAYAVPSGYYAMNTKNLEAYG